MSLAQYSNIKFALSIIYIKNKFNANLRNNLKYSANLGYLGIKHQHQLKVFKHLVQSLHTGLQLLLLDVNKCLDKHSHVTFTSHILHRNK